MHEDFKKHLNDSLINKESCKVAGKAIDDAMTARFTDFDPRLYVTLDPTIYKASLDASMLQKLGIRINNSGDECGQLASMRSIPKGQFWIATDCADDKGKLNTDIDVKMMDVFGKTIYFEWSETAVRCAMRENRNVLAENQSGTYDSYFAELLESALVGVWDNKRSIYLTNGLFTAPEFKLSTPAITISSLDTPEKLFQAVSNFITSHNTLIPDYYKNYSIDTVIIPTDLYLKLSSTMFASGVGMTVLSALATAYPMITFLNSHYADNINGKKYMVGFNRSENALILRVPRPLTFSDTVQNKGFCWRMDAKYAIAGLDVRIDGSGARIEVK